MEAQIDQKQANEQREQVPAWVLDLLLGIAVTLVIALVISAHQGGGQDPDLIAYLFAVGFGGLMLARRHYPVVVLVGSMFLLFAYYVLDYPAIGLAVPVVAALYSAAELGHLRAAIIVSLLLIVVSTYFRLQEGQSVAYLLGYELASTATLMATAIALGDSTRARRALRVEQEQTTRLIEQQHRQRAEQQVQSERLRMARDLHDVIGHSISVISLQAAVAKESIGRDDNAASQALAQIRTVSVDTMRELRQTVKLLRQPTGEQPARSVSTLANLPTLVENATASGLHVDLQLDEALHDLPATVEMAAYRIIQESLTNIIRHANATQVSLTIRGQGQTLHLAIIDNGLTPPAAILPGSGIVGMTERARLLGGTLSAQPHPTGGFAVNATLPLKDTP